MTARPRAAANGHGKVSRLADVKIDVDALEGAVLAPSVALVRLDGRQVIPISERDLHGGLYKLELARQVRAAANRATAVDLSGFTGSLWEEMQKPLALPEPAVERLANKGHVVTFPGPRKTGKTTFLLDLVRCGVLRLPFLGRFGTHLSGNPAIVNAEMLAEDVRAYAQPMPEKVLRRMFVLHCRELGIRLNLMNDAQAENLVEWLLARESEWLFLDPWKNFMNWAGFSLNDGDGAEALADRVRHIATEAGIALTVIPMHTPQTTAQPGQERAKGAGEVEDGADALWRYSRSGGPESARVLSVEGRGVGLSETTITFDAATGTLTATEGTRLDAAVAGMAEKLLPIIVSHPGISYRGLRDAVGIDDNLVNQGARALVEAEKVCSHGGGVGRATRHYPLSTCPNPSEHDVVIHMNGGN